MGAEHRDLDYMTQTWGRGMETSGKHLNLKFCRIRGVSLVKGKRRKSGIRKVFQLEVVGYRSMEA